MSTVRCHVDQNIAVITISNPPVNALSASVRIGLRDALSSASDSEQVRAIVITGDNKTFIAGADVREMGTEQARLAPRVRHLQELLANCNKLTVAAIRGHALGAGLELALCCDARVAVAQARLGFPEVMLGILPGAGGTQRLPRVAGTKVALDLLTSGRHFSGAEALELGIIDAIVTDVPDGAVAFAAQALRSKRMFVPVLARSDKLFPLEPGLFASFRAEVQSRNPGLAAPPAIVDCVEAACTMSAADGLAFEEAKLSELRKTDQHPALRHLFLARSKALHVPPELKDVTPLEVNRVAFVGSDPAFGAAEQALTANAISVIHAPARSIPTAARAAGGHPATELDINAAAAGEKIDLIFLAPIGQSEKYLPLLADLRPRLSADVILAVNNSMSNFAGRSSSHLPVGHVLALDVVATAGTKGLVHITNGRSADPVALKTLLTLCKRINMPLIVSHSGDACTRMWRRYVAQADFLLEEGATPPQIDRVAEAFGLGIGPMRSRDIMGLERACQLMRGDGNLERVSQIVERLIAAGFAGAGANRGFYEYEDGRHRFNPACTRIIEMTAAQLGIRPRRMTDEEVLQRLLLPVVAEATRCLEENVISRTSDIDVAWVDGYGFPAYRGGLMYWARRVGFKTVHAFATTLADRFGASWGPGALLSQLAGCGEDCRPHT